MNSEQLRKVDLVVIVIIGVSWLASDVYVAYDSGFEGLMLPFLVLNLAFLLLIKIYLWISSRVFRHFQPPNRAMDYLNGLAGPRTGGESALAPGSPNAPNSEHSGLSVLIDHYRLEADLKGIDFSFKLAAESCRLRQDDFIVTTVAGNLLNNAFEAIERAKSEMKKERRIGPRRVLLECECGEYGLCLRVFNDYPEHLRVGLKESELFREGFTTNEGPNRGNGLAIVKEMVDARDGVIYLDTSEGVAFIVEI